MYGTFKTDKETQAVLAKLKLENLNSYINRAIGQIKYSLDLETKYPIGQRSEEVSNMIDALHESLFSTLKEMKFIFGRIVGYDQLESAGLHKPSEWYSNMESNRMRAKRP